ncbi:uncharacterized protein A1O9_09696 [Exophiala aquamarina CBS 119918]|uniref:Major facilitator superfamily (MFS) profile domain-containing protein n=1 Tax=Exophiala aquamarina CBS 119918 TaxID=1182545 RepID=A0A072P338_9EURO|nr:uncharacterized protein A1O9_09696 [Exophiala aquamarina CBS 119918]KEF54529.1 hypothetical protein A1O9_09696 [Exophiala aquamarina CBS 119918]
MSPAQDDKGTSLSRFVPFTSGKPVFLGVRSSEAFILTAVCWSVFTDVFLYGIIVPVVPFALQDRVHVSHEDTQHWVSVLLSVYAAALLVVSPICGVIADRTTSRRGPLLLGLIVLFASTLMFCLGRTIAILVAARLLQGASAAVVWTVALALLADTVKQDEVGKALGYVSVAMTLGVLFGPMIGGIVYERLGYYPVFAVTFGVIGLDILLRLLLVEKKIAAKWIEPAPIPIQIQSAPSINDRIAPGQLEASSAVSEKNTTIAATRAAAANSRPKRRLPSMLILLKSRRLLAAFWGSLATSITMTALDTTIPLYVNQIFGWGSLGAGLVFLALLAPNLAGPLIGHWTDKYGPRWISAGGLLFSIPFWVLLRLVDHDGIRQQVLLCGLLLLLGIACAFIMTPLLAEFSKVCDAKVRQQPDLFAEKSAYAQSFGIFNVAWALGSLIGPLVAAGIIDAAGWKTMTWSMALFSAVGVLPALLYSGGMITRNKRRSSPAETSSPSTEVHVA